MFVCGLGLGSDLVSELSPLLSSYSVTVSNSSASGTLVRDPEQSTAVGSHFKLCDLWVEGLS